VLNKADAIDDKTIASRKKALEKASGGPVYVMSGVSKQGLTDVLRLVYSEIMKSKFVPAEDVPWQP